MLLLRKQTGIENGQRKDPGSKGCEAFSLKNMINRRRRKSQQERKTMTQGDAAQKKTKAGRR